MFSPPGRAGGEVMPRGIGRESPFLIAQLILEWELGRREIVAYVAVEDYAPDGPGTKPTGRPDAVAE